MKNRQLIAIGLSLMLLSLIPLIWGEVQLRNIWFRDGYGSKIERDQYRQTIEGLEDIHKLKRLAHLLLNITCDQEQSIVRMYNNQLSSNRWRFFFQIVLLGYLTMGFYNLKRKGAEK